MRKVKLLTALLAIVMVLPMVAGLGIRAAADGPLYQVLVYAKNPGEKNTVQSLHLTEQGEYAQGSMLVDANKQQIKDLTDNNIDFTIIGRADTCIVGGYDLKMNGKKLELPTIENNNLKQLADYVYPEDMDTFYVVRFVGPMKTDWIDRITSLGGSILDGYPLYPDTYLVRAGKNEIDGIVNQNFVRAYTLYSPILKTSSWPYDPSKNSGLWQTFVVAVAGNTSDEELAVVSTQLKGLGAKTILSAMIEKQLETKPPVKVDGMTDEEYDGLVKVWEEEMKSFKSYINEPVSDKDARTIQEASRIVTFGTSGSPNEENKYDVAYARVVLPVEKIQEIAKLPWVINIDLFVSPIAQNDIANYIIGSQYAWAANETSGVVANATDPLPHTRLDHFGLHGESLEPTQATYGGTHYRQVVAICGTGLDTGDVSDTYSISEQYGTPTGDFAYRVMDHLAYVRQTASGSNTSTQTGWRWPPNGGSGTRISRPYWANINVRISTYQSGVVGSRSYPWMDWDGHDTHVAGSALGDGFWSRGQTTPDDTIADRNPYDPTGAGVLPGNAPGSAVTNPRDRLPRINLDGATYGTNAADTFDYRGVAYRAGVIVQRVTDTNFVRSYRYYSYPMYRYYYYWNYAGRPKYLGLYSSPLAEAGYLRAPDAVFTILNDAYNLGAKIHIDAWVMPHRGPTPSSPYPSPAGDREITYDGTVALNSNEYNFCAEQIDRFCWERKDLTIVQAGTTNTRLAAPFIYDWEPLNNTYFVTYAPGSQYYNDGPNNGSQHLFNSPWCYTKPPMHEIASYYYPATIPQKGVYYPSIGDSSYNIEPPGNVEFNYYYQDITQPVSTDENDPFLHSDGKTDYASNCLSPATAKNPIVVGASESYRNITTLPAHLTRAAGPWSYGWTYGPWFPQTVSHTHGISSTSPLYGDNTANSDVPVGVQHATNGSTGLYYNELVGMAGSPSPTIAYNGFGQVAAFSGRGPTPDLDYSQSDPDPTKWQPAGRYKPDIVAPGTQIMSAASYLTLRMPGSIGGYAVLDPSGNPTGNRFDGVRQVTGNNTTTGAGGPYLLRHPGPSTNLVEHYAVMEGTSCATGFVGGAAAITRQYYQNRGLNMYPQPSSALIKATLVHGAANLGGQSDYAGNYSEWRWLSAKPNYDQGFGRLDIRRSLFPTAPTQAQYVDQVKGITTGERHFYYYEVTDATVPFEATMAYTDMPKLPNPQVALANDLDLIITAPDGVEYHGNIYTSDPHIDEHTNQYRYWGRESMSNPGGTNYDRRNNVERVVIPPTQVKRGTYTVTVSGARIEQSSTNIPQTYAFRVSGGNLKAAVTPPPQVPATSTWSLIIIILAMLAVGAFFLIRSRAKAHIA
ncbi:MAG: S8 family serine peptidase [Caldisericia bacterium]|nr:S8 family serine peptidase [Caldisericia bacterium]